MSLILWEVPNFVVDQKIKIDISPDTGELLVNFEGDGLCIGKLPLLFTEEGDNINVVNNWLIHLKVNLRKKEVNTQAQALLHYFTFLSDINVLWDEMPASLRKRPTYMFRRHLKNIFEKGALARSTANSYLRVVINFYKFYLSRKHNFRYPPFNYEVVSLHRGSTHEYMRSKFIYVDTTDLRLKLPNNMSQFGLPRKLIPLNRKEWESIELICNVSKIGVSKSKNGDKFVVLSEEFLLAIKLSRYSGLRRNEIITLRNKGIYKPDHEQIKRKYLIGADGLLLDPLLGIETKNGTVRQVEILSTLMQELYDYINSSRYIERRKKFEILHPEQKENPPLLINQKGDYYASKTLDARWGEVRNLVKKKFPNFSHKFHNLRSTYAVERLKELLNAGMEEGNALDYLQSVMGHKNRETLLGYLKFCESDILTANEIHELAIDSILNNGE